MVRWLFILSLSIIQGCTFNVAAPIAPAVNVNSSYAEKVPGLFVLVIDDSLRNMTREVISSTNFCGAHKFPVNMGDSLPLSIQNTMGAIFEQVLVMNSTPPDSALDGLGAKGTIVVKLHHFKPGIFFLPHGKRGIICDANSEISLGITIKGKGIVLLEESAGAARNFQNDAGRACENGANVLSEAIRLSVVETMESLAEKISNSPKVREYRKTGRI